MNDAQKSMLRDALTGNPVTEFHHGDCIGADSEADAIARSLGIHIVIHPPTNSSKRAFCFQPGDIMWAEQDYLVRNEEIVAVSDFLIAAPKGNVEELRSGTWATIRYARKANKAVLMLWRV